MDSIIPNTLSDSVTGGGLFEIVDIRSANGSIIYPSSFDIGAILSLTLSNSAALMPAPFWFTKPSSQYNVYFPTLYGSSAKNHISIYPNSISGFDAITIIFYKKKS